MWCLTTSSVVNSTDGLDWNFTDRHRFGCRVAPVMGAGYHTLHHTVYNKNYGHYFTYMDKLHNTLFTPEEDEERRQQRQQRQK